MTGQLPFELWVDDGYRGYFAGIGCRTAELAAHELRSLVKLYTTTGNFTSQEIPDSDSPIGFYIELFHRNGTFKGNYHINVCAAAMLSAMQKAYSS